MLVLWIILHTILISLAVCCGVYWGFALAIIRTNIRSLPRGVDGVQLADDRGTPEGAVCVVIPAHNERAVIADIVRSLRAQDHPGFTVVLALDRCTDDTRAVAEAAIDADPRFEIIEITDCPPDWAGKVHAVHAGVTRSKSARAADYLLFTDADCQLHPACLRATVALLEGRGLDLLSLHSDQSHRAWFEFAVQPVACLELVRMYPLLRANRHDDKARPFANGQFMLFRATAYHAIGGHEAVKDELLEDIAFARLTLAEGHRPGLLASGGIMSCRMYDNWAQFTRGWKRIFTESANRRSDRLRRAAFRLRVSAIVLPVASLLAILTWYPTWHNDHPILAGFTLASSGVGFIFWLAFAVLFAREGNIPYRTIPLWPWGALLVARILDHAARDLRQGKPTQWGGRTYDRPDRDPRRAPVNARAPHPEPEPAR